MRNLFRLGWRRRNHRDNLAAVSKVRSTRKLIKMATQSNDEWVRLEAAMRLNDSALIKALACSATQEPVRVKAAIEINDQTCLTSFALKAWNIHLGEEAIRHIHNPMLLRRLARSAKQDALRLAAALKLKDENLLRHVARSSNHVDVHWQVAHYLQDACMLAEIAAFKPGSMHLEPMRRKARRALMELLERFGQKKDHLALLDVIKSSTSPVFKLEAFVRLPSDQITPSVLAGIAGLDLRYIPRELLDSMINHIKAGGWQVDLSIQHTPCIFCRGTGQLALKYISTNDTWSDLDVFVCPDCKGLGKVPYRQTICTRPKGECVTLRLPV